MKLDFMMLANYAEVANGLLYISGGTWDTTNVNAPPPPEAKLPDETVAIIQGTLVARLLFHVTETGREHSFTVTIMDEDGGEIAKIEGRGVVNRTPDLPAGWDQGMNVAVPLTGTPLPQFGHYSVSLQVDEQHVADLPFRVVKRY